MRQDFPPLWNCGSSWKSWERLGFVLCPPLKLGWQTSGGSPSLLTIITDYYCYKHSRHVANKSNCIKWCTVKADSLSLLRLRLLGHSPENSQDSWPKMDIYWGVTWEEGPENGNNINTAKTLVQSRTCLYSKVAIEKGWSGHCVPTWKDTCDGSEVKNWWWDTSVWNTIQQWKVTRSKLHLPTWTNLQVLNNRKEKIRFQNDSRRMTVFLWF